jgi:hypothetical protein
MGCTTYTSVASPGSAPHAQGVRRRMFWDSPLLPFALTESNMVTNGGDHGRTIRRVGCGEFIPGTDFRQMITSVDTGGRFSSQSAVLGPGELVPPHSHRDEDEFTFVF